MAETGLKLFCLARKDKNPHLDRLRYYGDNYGTIYQSEEFVVATSAKDAVDVAWKEAVACTKTYAKVPVFKEKWWAKEVVISGYIITIKKT